MDDRALALLTRLTEALERLAPAAAHPADLYAAEAFVWQPSPAHLVPVEHVSRVDIGLLKGVEQQKSILLENTLRFTRGLPANNAMLWGARGTASRPWSRRCMPRRTRARPAAWC